MLNTFQEYSLNFISFCAYGEARLYGTTGVHGYLTTIWITCFSLSLKQWPTAGKPDKKIIQTTDSFFNWKWIVRTDVPKTRVKLKGLRQYSDETLPWIQLWKYLTYRMHFSKTSLTNLGLGFSRSWVRQSDLSKDRMQWLLTKAFSLLLAWSDSIKQSQSEDNGGAGPLECRHF